MSEPNPPESITGLRDTITALISAAQAAVNADPVAREHFANVGELLLEAYPQLSYAEWRGWLKRNLQMSVREADAYMTMARRRHRQQQTEKGGA